MVNEKNKPGMPVNSIEWLLRNYPEIDAIALASRWVHEPGWYEMRGASRFRKLDTWEKGRVDHLVNKVSWPLRRRFDPYFRNRLDDRKKMLLKIIDKELPIKVVEHHRAHACSAYYGSHYTEDDKILTLTADGSGDGLSSTVNIGLSRITKTGRGGSVGEIYSLTTHYLGFRAWEHEYKLMGLAPYAAPDPDVLDGLRAIMSVKKGQFISTLDPDFAWGYLTKLYYRKRFDRICASLQQWFEEIMTEWVLSCSDTFVSPREVPFKLACAGGTFMNVKGNKIISELEEIQDMFIFPSAGDETTCIGAAMDLYSSYCLEHGMEPRKEIHPVEDMCLGPRAGLQYDLEHSLRQKRIRVEETDPKTVTNWIVENLAKGEIVARCSGKCEFGARALGNRSIMAMATDPRITDPLNAVIKQRDFWMPFAPSLLEEDQHELIVNPKNLKAKWMIQAFDTTSIGEDQLAAAMHRYDKTVRPQTVTKENGQYYDILSAFKEQIGLSGFLNTSFNLHGFPIVRDAGLAIETMLNSGLKKMVIENWILEKV